MTRLEHDWFPDALPDNVVLEQNAYVDTSYSFRHMRSERPEAVRLGECSSTFSACDFHLGPRGGIRVGRYTSLIGVRFALNSMALIGDHTMMSEEVYVSDVPCPIPPGDPAYDPSPAPSEVSVVVGDACWVGVRSVLLAGARLGDGAIVGAGCVVDFEVPEHAVVGGNPARIVGWARPSQTPPR